MAKNTLTVDRFIDVNKAVVDTATNAVDSGSLKESVTNQSGLIFYYGAKYADAIRQASRIKLRLERDEAKLSNAVRAEALANGTKVTVDQVKDAVAEDNEILALKVALVEAVNVENTLKALVGALKDKSDNLQSLLLMYRDEVKQKLMWENDVHGNQAPSKNRYTGKAAQE